MSTIFPGSASVGQIFDGYSFDGTAWNIIGNEFNPTYFSPTAPDNPKAGDLWVDSISNVPSISPETILTISSASATYQPLVSGVSSTEIGYLDGVTSAIQTQIDARLTIASASTTYATQENFPAGAWQSYTPVWGSNGTAPALVNGTISGLYSKFGKTVHVRIYMQLGSSSTVGTGQRYSWTLPFNNKQLTTCNLIFLDSSANAYYIGVGRTNATNIDFVMNQFGPGTLTGAGLFGPASPVVPASGDFYILTATYEEA